MIFTDERRRRGNVLVTPAVQMTAAASGSSGIVVADSDEYDFGETDFGIFSTIQYQLLYCEVQHKKQSSIERWVFYINGTDNLAGAPLGTPTLVCLVGGSAVIAVEAPAQIPASIAVVSIGVSVIRETAGSAGSAQFFYNGAPLGAPVSIAAAATQSLSNTGPLYLSGDDSKRFASDVISAILLNFAPTASQVAQLYSSGIPAEWMWGSNVPVYASDFSAGVDGWANLVNTTVAGNVDGIGGRDNVLSAYADNVNTTHFYRCPSICPPVGEFSKISLMVYIPSSNTNVNGFILSDFSSAAQYIRQNTPALDAWTLYEYEGDILSTNGLGIYMQKDGSTVFAGANSPTDDLIYIVDVSTLRLGATLALLPETLPTSGALEWPDSSTNDNDGTLPAAGASKVTIRR